MVQSINNKKLAHDIAIDLMLIPCSLHFICLRFSAENVGGYLIYTERNKARRLGNTEIKKTRYRKLMED